MKTIKKFNYKTIKSFEDACKSLNVDSKSIFSENDSKDEIAYKKLKIIFKAINNGWVLEMGNSNQYKYYPWFGVLSSGFGVSDSIYHCTGASVIVGSRLCTDTSEKALYIAKQFEAEYKDYLL